MSTAPSEGRELVRGEVIFCFKGETRMRLAAVFRELVTQGLSFTKSGAAIDQVIKRRQAKITRRGGVHYLVRR